MQSQLMYDDVIFLGWFSNACDTFNFQWRCMHAARNNEMLKLQTKFITINPRKLASMMISRIVEFGHFHERDQIYRGC